MYQSVSITQPYLPLFNRSWTFEAWIYLSSATIGTDYPIAGQCSSRTPDQCLHLVVRDTRLRLGFFSDDLPGVTNLAALRWYHTAFVFDNATKNQSLYLDGVLDVTRKSNQPYQGTNRSLTFGRSDCCSFPTNFDGLIDQLFFTNRSRTPQEILRDATLTVSFSFDSNTTIDEGPLEINGSLAGNTTFVVGRRGQGLQIDNANDSYFTVQGLVLLGRDNQSYSLSIWIKPAVQQRASIIHMSDNADGTGWSLPMIGLSNTGQLAIASWGGAGIKVFGPVVPVSSWTHVASTYDLASGFRLYVNGSLYNSSSQCSFEGSAKPNYLLVGSPREAIVTSWWPDVIGQYSGVVDELRVYSRELSLSEISILADL